LDRNLTVLDLSLLGIGAIIGTGIFVLTGVAGEIAGPSLVFSFLLAGFVCFFSALSYAEFSSILPVAGSVYAYSYITMGEFIAWMIGWDLMLQYLFSASTVSVGWSGYFQSLLSGFNIHLPSYFTAAPFAKKDVITYFNLPAFLMVIFITFLLSRGTSKSKHVNNFFVFFKLFVILLFIVVGIFYVKPSNFKPFVPFGLNGIFYAAAIVFFAFIGFDTVAAAAEETKNPKRDLPRGILFSLLFCTILYILVSIITMGIVPLDILKQNVDHPISLVISLIGQNWIAFFIDLGAILGMISVMFAMIYGQTRIAMAMCRDGLLPNSLAKIDSKYQTPYRLTWLVGLIAAMIGAFVPLDKLAELVNIGTLFAFSFVSLAVIILRKTHPDLPRAFRCPFVPFVPLLSIFSCIFLMLQLKLLTWVAFLVWLLLGVIFYFSYSFKHSKLNKDKSDMKVLET